ncbi:transcription initiation factor Spt4 [Ahrensia sp. R2A130]|nr:transcription initiation factor Spt4 [Ahrensia sp. R2A130]
MREKTAPPNFRHSRLFVTNLRKNWLTKRFSTDRLIPDAEVLD